MGLKSETNTNTHTTMKNAFYQQAITDLQLSAELDKREIGIRICQEIWDGRKARAAKGFGFITRREIRQNLREYIGVEPFESTADWLMHFIDTSLLRKSCYGIDFGK